ncbi:MAG: TetR/AcrR family transcriptional regulator [Oleibacter sp.]|nr:TetR/AcrR family transcriptional regulator [Thalassolituus sp.]
MSTSDIIFQAQQQRSKATADRVLVALEHLLRQQSFDQLRLQDIAKEADASVSSIYARFNDKSAILFALHEQIVARLTQRMILQFNDSKQVLTGSLQNLVLFIITDFIAFAREHEHVYRAVVGSGDARVYARIIEQIRLASKLATAYLGHQYNWNTDADKVRIDMGVRVVAATLQQTWVMNHHRPSLIHLDDSALANELTNMLCLYLPVTSPQERSHKEQSKQEKSL